MPRRRDRVELRDVLDPRAVRDRRRERHVQLHQEMRADGDVERLGEMRDLEPRRDAADARAVDLHDRARVALEVFAEVRRGGRSTRRRRSASSPSRASSTWPAEILGRQRLLEPARAPSGAYACARRSASATVNAWFASTIISKASPTASRTAREPAHVLGDRRLADLDLGAAKALRLRRDRFVDQLLRASGGASRPRSCRRELAAARRRRLSTAAVRRAGT